MSSFDSQVAAFTEAQNAYYRSAVATERQIVKRDTLFGQSAIAAAAAIAAGASLGDLVAANIARFGKIAETAIGKGTLYTSKVSMSWHAWTGEIVSLPVADGDEPVVAVGVQALVKRVFQTKGLGAADIRAAIDAPGQTRQGAVTRLAELAEAAKSAAAAAKSAPAATDADTDTDAPAAVREPAQTIATLLARVAALLDAGATVTDADRAAYVGLAAQLAPAAVKRGRSVKPVADVAA